MESRPIWISIIRHGISVVLVAICAALIFFFGRWVMWDSSLLASWFTLAFIARVATDKRVWR